MIFPNRRSHPLIPSLAGLAPAGPAALALLFAVACFESDNLEVSNGTSPELSEETLASQVAASLTEEEMLSLSDELRVRPGELALFDYWDALRETDVPMQHLGKLPVKSVVLPEGASGAIADVLAPGGEWATLIAEIEDAHGYSLTWSHWEHVTFDPKSNPPQSIVDAELHFNSGSRRARTILKAELTANWSAAGPSAPGEPPFTEVAMRVTEIAEGQDPAFHRLENVPLGPLAASSPNIAATILVRDLNADHYPEVILLASNELLWNQANCTFVSQPLVPDADAGAVQLGFRAGTFGEFTGDGRKDLMLIDSEGAMFVLAGAPAGAFEAELIPVPTAPVAANATKLAAADIDGDGDTDLYIAQDKPLFVDGQMPSPANNAASGNPGFMLRNDGSLRFTDISDECGLREKRLRRVKDAAFHDYDADGDPDLFLASGFAPIDILENRDARFADVSGTSLNGRPAPLIASSISFADFSGDGVHDLAVAAVESSAGARIEAMRRNSDTSAISSLGGNAPLSIAASSSRLLVNTPHTTDTARSVLSSSARTFDAAEYFLNAGWANDAAVLDYDNDGDLDVYIANGNISGTSTRDFDLYFWQRELRAATALEDPVIALLFTDGFRPEPFQGLNEGHISWQGHQSNRFFRNEGTARQPAFREAGFLEGAALIEDCRAVEACDLDLDGKIDLLVLAESWQGTSRARVLAVLRNEGVGSNNWIGFQFDNVPPGRSLAGTTVVLEFGEERRTLALEDGASTLHLGLGDKKGPSRAEIRWPDGTKHFIDAPSIGRYMRVQFALD